MIPRLVEPQIFFGDDGLIDSSCSEVSKERDASFLQGVRFRDWITDEASQTLQEEFPDIIGHTTDRLVATFKDHILGVKSTDGIVEVTRE